MTASKLRRASRRAVDIPCELVSRHLDQPLLYWATDLTPFGAWIETSFPMQVGEVVVLCFAPGMCWSARELMLFARVQRVQRSTNVTTSSGMALEFLDITAHEQRVLSGWLRWRPPPLPSRRARRHIRRVLPTARKRAA